MATRTGVSSKPASLRRDRHGSFTTATTAWNRMEVLSSTSLHSSSSRTFWWRKCSALQMNFPYHSSAGNKSPDERKWIESALGWKRNSWWLSRLHENCNQRELKMSLALCCDDSVSRKYLYKTPFHTARCEMEIKSVSYKNVFRKIFSASGEEQNLMKATKSVNEVGSVVFSLGQWTTDGRKSSRFKIKLQLIDSCFCGENFFRLIRHLFVRRTFPNKSQLSTVFPFLNHYSYS